MHQLNSLVLELHCHTAVPVAWQGVTPTFVGAHHPWAWTQSHAEIDLVICRPEEGPSLCYLHFQMRTQSPGGAQAG